MTAGPPGEASPATFPAARLDRPTRVVTFALGLLVGLLLPALLTGLAGEETRAATGVVLGLGGAGLVLAAWGASPREFEIDRDMLRVRRRLLPDRAYALTGRVERAPATLGLGFLIGGTGGMFGWSGRFSKPGLGRYRAHLTDRSRIVACTTETGLVVLSPADPEGFCAAARKARR